MWKRLAAFILGNRALIIVGLALLTGAFATQAVRLDLNYDAPQIIPPTDPDFQYYQSFKAKFGEDNDLIVIGMQGKNLWNREVFASWQKLYSDLKAMPGIQSVAGIPGLQVLLKDTLADSSGFVKKRFLLQSFVPPGKLSSPTVDSLHRAYDGLRFYEGLFYNKETGVTLMAAKMRKSTLTSRDRVGLVDSITLIAKAFEKQTGASIHISGLPYIRTLFARSIRKELNWFLVFSILVTGFILLLFFRSFTTVVFPLLLIGIVVIWTFGSMVLLGYKITLLTGLVPPLIVIIAVPNYIYFLNRYHTEYHKFGDKRQAIVRMVQTIATVVFLNNLTTAIGFGVLYFVDSPMLKEFGLVAFLMICFTYLISVILLPLVLSYLPPPSTGKTRYTSNPLMLRFLNRLIFFARYRRRQVYVITAVLAIVSIFGITRLRAVGHIMDDIPSRSPLSTDLAFFDRNFKGVMPFEIVLDGKNKNAWTKQKNLANLAALQAAMDGIPGFAGSRSVADVASYARQTFYNGNPERYAVPEGREATFLLPYIRSLQGRQNAKDTTSSFGLVDRRLQIARVSAKMSDIGSIGLTHAVKTLDSMIPAIMGDSATMGYRYTGYSLIFLKGNGYLIKNLYSSLIWAVLLIALAIAILFRSARLVAITILPNILAVLFTAALMGFLGIPLKPSTVLVFSIAFGIGCDASFHFLVRYRADLKSHNWDVTKTVGLSLRETGLSILYTTLVLFFGFGIFCFSSFGSTVSLGALTGITLITATFTNMVVIPALLVAFDQKPKRLLFRKKRVDLPK